MKRQVSMASLDSMTDAPGAIDNMNDDNFDDVNLMASIANGDKNAFNHFLSRHLPAVVQFARRYLSSQADAEDIAQETFFRVWRKAVTWQPQGYSPRGWLYRIAYNLCIDEIRRKPVNQHLSNDVTENISEQDSDSLEVSIETDSDLYRLTHLLKQLPERQRTALSLCALQGLSNKEAAIVMDISIDALESLLSRGRRQLRNHMKNDGANSHE